ncbi:S4 domain-containing protein [Aquabacter cavernae]|uniref:S4 domain-containing protein n=1 Tax=Aquabacter cavernae TaxID=2496029 RepID=UPI000F8F4040|nr:S4 domain-containing protein [Aquabacter cavernae]
MARQRLDLWLWHARVVRGRADAAALVREGHVRVDGARVTSAGHMVRIGQVVTVSLHHAVRVLRVIGFSERREDATSAIATYEEITD